MAFTMDQIGPKWTYNGPTKDRNGPKWTGGPTIDRRSYSKVA